MSGASHNALDLDSLAATAQALYRRRPWPLSREMNPHQRTRMIARFHARKMASPPRSLEHYICACVVIALLYGGSVRTVNGIAKRTRASWRASNA